MRRPEPARSERFSVCFFHRSVLRPTGFRRTPPWCRGVIYLGTFGRSWEYVLFYEGLCVRRYLSWGFILPFSRGSILRPTFFAGRRGLFYRNLRTGTWSRPSSGTRHQENAFFGMFYRQPIWAPLHRGLRRIRSLPVSGHIHKGVIDESLFDFCNRAGMVTWLLSGSREKCLTKLIIVSV